METSVGEFKVSKTARFVVEQRVEKAWPSNTTMTYSEAVIADLWEINPSTGVLTVPKTSAYNCVLSGTAGKANTSLALFSTSSSETVQIEKFQDNFTRRYVLTEENYKRG